VLLVVQYLEVVPQTECRTQRKIKVAADFADEREIETTSNGNSDETGLFAAIHPLPLTTARRSRNQKNQHVPRRRGEQQKSKSTPQPQRTRRNTEKSP